jgi:hypothetical protein
MDGVPREQVSAPKFPGYGNSAGHFSKLACFSRSERDLSTISTGAYGRIPDDEAGQFRTQQGVRAERIYRLSRATGAKAAELCAVKPGQALKRFVPATSLHAQAKLTLWTSRRKWANPYLLHHGLLRLSAHLTSSSRAVLPERPDPER